MQVFTLKKTGLMIALVIVLLIILEMIAGVVSERSRYRNEARHSIAQSWTGAQKLTGPVLVVPYTEKVVSIRWDKQLKQEITDTRSVQRTVLLMPEDLRIDSNAVTEMRARGMYSVPVFTSRMKIRGSFNNRPLLDLLRSNDRIVSCGQPWLAVMINDIRGVPARPQVLWNGEEISFASGSRVNGAAQGMHARLPAIDISSVKDYSFSFSMDLRGMESLSFNPAGINTRVRLDSDWPHPGFNGRYLPENRQIDASGFSAEWQVSSFSSDIGQQLQLCNAGNCQPLLANSFGVTLVQPVDIYQQSERSIKYAILFISLTFVVFILFELIKRLKIHPLQYLFVGLALVIFYLLLLSFSEHIAFHWAYLLASIACSGLLGVYLSGVLHDYRLGAGLAAVIALLYGILYVILSAEDLALLMGCILLFAVLAIMMVITRQIDWYDLNDRSGYSAGDGKTMER